MILYMCEFYINSYRPEGNKREGIFFSEKIIIFNKYSCLEKNILYNMYIIASIAIPRGKGYDKYQIYFQKNKREFTINCSTPARGF